jgi:hypothetical protein
MRKRANINLDADVYDFASAYAAARGLALGAAVSELLRSVQQMSKPANMESPRLKRTRRGFLVVAKTGQVITPDKVKDFSEDDLA